MITILDPFIHRVYFLLFEHGPEQVWRTLLELIRVDEGLPDVLKRYATLLARVVVWIAVLWTLADVMTGLLAPLTDVTLRQTVVTLLIAT